jgi:hypothetical protein
MKVIVLSPVKFVEKFSISDMYLVLSWLLKENEEYRDLYINKIVGYKILDNGAFEGRLSPFEENVTLARQINAQEVQLPDYLFDFKKTLQEAKAVIGKGLPPDLEVQFVVQGLTFEELTRAVDFAVKNNFIIGIPHEPCQIVFKRNFIPREPLIAWIEENYGKSILRRIHLLGCHDMFEFYSLYYQKCRSMDTTLPVKLGLKRITLPSIRDVKRPSDYFQISRIDGTQMDCILRNLEFIRSIVEDPCDKVNLNKMQREAENYVQDL